MTVPTYDDVDDVTMFNLNVLHSNFGCLYKPNHRVPMNLSLSISILNELPHLKLIDWRNDYTCFIQKTHRFKTSISPELIEDLKCISGLDAEMELQKILIDEIRVEYYNYFSFDDIYSIIPAYLSSDTVIDPETRYEENKIYGHYAIKADDWALDSKIIPTDIVWPDSQI